MSKKDVRVYLFSMKIKSLPLGMPRWFSRSSAPIASTNSTQLRHFRFRWKHFCHLGRAFRNWNKFLHDFPSQIFFSFYSILSCMGKLSYATLPLFSNVLFCRFFSEQMLWRKSGVTRREMGCKWKRYQAAHSSSFSPSIEANWTKVGQCTHICREPFFL